MTYDISDMNALNMFFLLHGHGSPPQCNMALLYIYVMHDVEHRKRKDKVSKGSKS